MLQHHCLLVVPLCQRNHNYQELGWKFQWPSFQNGCGWKHLFPFLQAEVSICIRRQVCNSERERVAWCRKNELIVHLLSWKRLYTRIPKKHPQLSPAWTKYSLVSLSILQIYHITWPQKNDFLSTCDFYLYCTLFPGNISVFSLLSSLLREMFFHIFPILLPP